jgi:hypothetical protein
MPSRSRAKMRRRRKIMPAAPIRRRHLPNHPELSFRDRLRRSIDEKHYSITRIQKIVKINVRNARSKAEIFTFSQPLGVPRGAPPIRRPVRRLWWAYPRPRTACGNLMARFGRKIDETLDLCIRLVALGRPGQNFSTTGLQRCRSQSVLKASAILGGSSSAKRQRSSIR